ncbi:hypothetical protein HAHE_11840 [Haloferula helveola]|uniref:Uncharacterized protein n=1 Tax=Haloferula helveola TaxID=490095 RepID=A0ABM7RC89_9BACT|nr:hypothetical protein HAHE_11840 [Haloferula helveola]
MRKRTLHPLSAHALRRIVHLGGISLPLALLLAGNAAAQVTVTNDGSTAPTLGLSDTGYITASNGRFGWDEGELHGQRFTLANSITLDSIYIAYNGFGADSGSFTITVDAGDDGSNEISETGITLDSADFSGVDQGDANSGPIYWMRWDLSTHNLTLPAGTSSFLISLDSEGNPGSGWLLAPLYNNGNPYAGGRTLGLSGGASGNDALFAVTAQVPDADSDGLPDDYELANTNPPSTTALVPALDDDGDGLSNEQEFLGQDALGAEHGFGQTQAILADTDGDGLEDGPEVAGTDNGDASHGYGATNPNDDDSDDDGIGDNDEVIGALNTAHLNESTDPNDEDTDSDLMNDLYEVTNNLLGGLDPNDVTDGGLGMDLDGDGIDNLEEHDATPQTRADKADTDGDGYDDPAEDSFGSWLNATATGTSPVDPDSDGDGLLDGDENLDLGSFQGAGVTPAWCDPNVFDTDGDLYGDGDEVAAGTDPNLDTSVPTGIPFRSVDFSGTGGGWQSAGGTTLESTTELLPGTGQYALIDASTTGNGLRIEHGNPAAPFYCSVDLRVEGALGVAGAGGFNILSAGIPSILSDAGTHCILRLFDDGSVQAYDGSAFLSVVPAGGIAESTTYTAQIDHDVLGGTWAARVYDRAAGTLVGSITGVPTRPTSDPNADPLYFTVGFQPPVQDSWDVAVDNMLVSLNPIIVPVTSVLSITDTGFNGTAFEMTVTGFDTSKMYVLKRSTDLVTFTGVGSAFTPAGTTQVVSDDPAPAGAAFYQVEEVP